jgi:hypothetical protein
MRPKLVTRHSYKPGISDAGLIAVDKVPEKPKGMDPGLRRDDGEREAA